MQCEENVDTGRVVRVILPVSEGRGLATTLQGEQMGIYAYSSGLLIQVRTQSSACTITTHALGGAGPIEHFCSDGNREEEEGR